MKVKVIFEPRDLWIGVYIKQRNLELSYHASPVQPREVFICLLPCLPIHVTWTARITVSCNCFQSIQAEGASERHRWQCPAHGEMCMCAV